MAAPKVKAEREPPWREWMSLYSAERLQPRRDSIEDQSTRKVREPSGFQWNSLRMGWVVAGSDWSERELVGMWIDNGVIAGRKDGIAGENWRGYTLVGKRSVNDGVGDPYAGDVDGAGAEELFEDGEDDGHGSILEKV